MSSVETDALTTLLAAIARAERSGHTDDDMRQIDLCTRLGKALIDLLDDYADKDDGNGGLSAYRLLFTLMGVAGVSLKTSYIGPDALSKLGLAADLAQLFLTAAMED